MQSVGHSVRRLATHWTDGKRFCVLPSIMCPRAENRLKGPREREAGECVDVGFGCYIVKGNFSSLVVQKDAHTPGGLLHPQAGWGNGGCLVLISLHHHHHPVAILWRQSDAPLSVYGCFTDAQDPLCLVSHLHFPVMAAREEARRAQGDDTAIKSFRAVRQTVPLVSKSHTLQVIREDEIGVGGFYIQKHINLQRELEYMGTNPTGSPLSRKHGQGCSSRTQGTAQGPIRPRPLALILALTSMCLSTNQFGNTEGFHF